MRIETLAVHGSRPDPETGAVSPPIHLSSTFEREGDGSYRAGYVYSRTANPTRDALERAMAELEGGVQAACFASGSAATAGLLMALDPGDHVILPDDVYYGTPRLVTEHFARWGLAWSVVDMTDLDALERAIRAETRVIWVETPSNPLLKITDIARVAEIAHAAGARCVCDNTWSTPVLTRPLEHGADVVLHSTTKYIGGHSDMLGGAVVSRADDDYFQRVRSVQASAGGVPSPFDCWLAMRGLRTLGVRMHAHSAGAARVAAFLESHGAIAAVHYPGLPTHPGHDIAARQMADYGGMLSAEFAGGPEAAIRAAARLELFISATSLGGTESLVEHRASVEGPESRTPPALLRFSVGLEHPEDLIADLERALG
jgi:cystathionine gamma-synthase